MRIARLYFPGVVHHVITRLVDRRFFFDVTGAREKYLVLLGRSLERSDWRCLSYALMSNHIHLVLAAGEETPESWLKRVHSPFARWMNQRVEGLGPLLADRPKMRIVPRADVSRVIAYVHNNPVSAGVVGAAALSSWTSHQAYLGRAAAPTWLHVDEGLVLCGFPADAAAFDQWVNAQPHDSDPVLEGERLLRAARTSRSDGSEVSTPIIGMAGRAVRLRRGSGVARPRPQLIIDATTRVLGIAAAEIGARNERTIELRRIALRVAVGVGCSIASVSFALGISRQRGSELAATRVDTDDAVIRIITTQVERSVDKPDTVPMQVDGKKGRRARRS